MLHLDLTLPTVEENLALDEALLVEVEEGRLAPLLRTWESPRVAVVLGASGRLRDDVIVDRCAADSVPIARRSSGGGTVVIGPGAPNFTVVLPRDFAPGLEAVDFAQRFVLGRVADLLRPECPGLEVRGSGDLAVSGRKVSGSAQRRLKAHFLVHATILNDFPLDLIPRYTREPSRRPSYREGRTHSEFVANLGLPPDRLVGLLRAAWDAFEEGGTGAVASALDRVPGLVAEKIGDPSWIARL